MLLTVFLHEKHIRLSNSSVCFVTLEALVKVTVELLNLECDTVHCGTSILTFQRILLPSLSG